MGRKISECGVRKGREGAKDDDGENEEKDQGKKEGTKRRVGKRRQEWDIIGWLRDE